MKKCLISLFIAIPLVLLSVILLADDRIFSENENRNLMIKSELSHNVLKGGFQTDFETLLADQFPLRDLWKSIFSEGQILCGKREIGGTYICRDYRLVQHVEAPDTERLVRYADKIDSIAAHTGLKTYVMYVPSAETVCHALLPAGAPVYNADILSKTLEAHLPHATLIIPTLTSNDYYLTDHHWNYDGVLLAYQAWKSAHGETPRSFEKKTFATDFQGTLYAKVLSRKVPFDVLCAPVVNEHLAVNADGSDIALYDMEALKTKDKYNVFEGGNHGIVVIENQTLQNGKTLLIFKDSFANSFVPFLVGDYEKIVMIDERYTFEDVTSRIDDYGATEIAVIRELIS